MNSYNIITKNCSIQDFIQSSLQLEASVLNHYAMESSVTAIIIKVTLVYASLIL